MKQLVAKHSTREFRALGADARDASNDDELDAEALAEIDAQFAPAFIRTPELDRRASLGHSFNANAWREVATGKTKFFCTGFDANSGQWSHVMEVRR